MNLKKRRISYSVVFAVLLIISSFVSYAFSFNAKVDAVNDHISIEERAIFNITVFNFLNSTEDFKIKNFDYPVWDINPEPMSNPIIVSVGPNSNNTIQIHVNSLQPVKTPVGTYSINARVDFEKTGESLDLPLTVAIKSTNALIGGYLPNVKTFLSVPEKADPREPFIIKVSLKNLNNVKYDALKVRISSKNINEEQIISLNPAGEGSIHDESAEKIIEITKNFSPLMLPQKDRITVDVLLGSRRIGSESSNYEIAEYIDIKQPIEHKQILRSVNTIKAYSNNQYYKGDIKLQTSLFRNLFTSASPDAELENVDGKYYYVWKASFDGKNEIEVSITENFRHLVVMVIFGLAFILLYFIFRSPLVVKKEVANVRTKEGGVSDMKVIIKVKNRSGSQLTGIEVTDNITSIAEVEKEISIGSMQPAKVLRHPQHPHKGGVIKWDIESIEAGDERVLSYKFRSRFPILGEFSLPSASARCKYGKRQVISNSNRAVVGSH